MNPRQAFKACMVMLAAVIAAGCKADGNRFATLLGHSFNNVAPEPETNPTSKELSDDPHESHVALVSSESTVAPIHTLRPDEDLDDIVGQASGVVLVDFYADWCGPCKKQSKVLHDVQDYASSVNARIVKVNVDQHRELAGKYQVASLPTLMVMRDGQVSQSKTGFTQRSQIERMLR